MSGVKWEETKGDRWGPLCDNNTIETYSVSQYTAIRSETEESVKGPEKTGKRSGNR